MLVLTKTSFREARKCDVGDELLKDAVMRARKGSVDAQLGPALIKQEVARPPKGRKTACRAIIAFRRNERFSVVLHVFAKSAKANLTPRERDAFDDLSRHILALSDDQIDELIRTKGWKAIKDDSQD